jgi:hypothetical protein
MIYEPLTSQKAGVQTELGFSTYLQIIELAANPGRI